MITEVTMKFFKSTKGTHVYKDEDPDSHFSTAYISRKAFKGEPPAEITVTVKEKE